MAPQEPESQTSETGSTPESEDEEAPSTATDAVRSHSHHPRKGRHERHRFEREEHRFTPRRAARRKVETLPRTVPTSVARTGQAPAPTSAPDALPSPTMMRIQKARKRFWRRFTGFFVGLSLAGAGAAALFAPGFNIEAVTVTGLHATSRVLVEPIAARLLGHNVFRAPKAPIVESVERLPTVAKARVVLRRGEGLVPRVVLQVRERVPVVRVGDGANWWVADAEGLPYRRANARDGALPFLRWNGVQTLRRFDTAQWDDALRLVQAVEGKRNGVGLPGVRFMRLDASGDATLSVRQFPGAPDLTVRLGNDGWSEKVARARVALAFFRRTKRDAAELNLIARAPNGTRWTPRATPVQSGGNAPQLAPQPHTG